MKFIGGGPGRQYSDRELIEMAARVCTRRLADSFETKNEDYLFSAAFSAKVAYSAAKRVMMQEGENEITFGARLHTRFADAPDVIHSVNGMSKPWEKE